MRKLAKGQLSVPAGSDRGQAAVLTKEMKRMILMDTHADTLYRRFKRPGEHCDVTGEKMDAGGVTVQTMALFVGGSPLPADMEATFAGMWAEGEKLPGEGFVHLTDYRDAREGQRAFVYSVEGCDLLDGRMDLLAAWREKGVRMAALTWNYENCVGVPAKVDAERGLKPFGREAVREMARLGIAPDTSHLNERGFYELLEMGVVPLASHSCCKALCGHARNLTDDQLRALFEAGGYVGVNFYPFFLEENGKADLDTVCDHVLRMLSLGGEGHIGFGSDFDGIECKPRGLNGPQDFPALLSALRRRGVGEEQIIKMAGQNLMDYYDRIDPRT